MGTVETFDHTADVGLRIRAADLDDLFDTAAGALFDYMVANRGEIRQVVAESFDLHAESPTDLMIVWLNELIYRAETGHRLYRTFKVDVSESGTHVVATIRGEPIDPPRHVLDHEVKAATRHGAEVRRGDEGWIAEFILDI